MGCAPSQSSVKSRASSKFSPKELSPQLKIHQNKQQIYISEKPQVLFTQSSLDSRKATQLSSPCEKPDGETDIVIEADDQDYKELEEHISKQLKQIAQNIPKYQVTERYLVARQTVRMQRQSKENPAPFIHKTIKDSFLMKKRSRLVERLQQELEQ